LAFIIAKVASLLDIGPFLNHWL